MMIQVSLWLQANDPFGADPFNPGGKGKAPPRPSKSPAPGAQRTISPAPSLPPKQKKAPPRPPAPKGGAKSPVHNISPMPAMNQDPFGDFDPFAGSTTHGGGAKSADLFSGSNTTMGGAKSHSADLFSGPSAFAADFSGVSTVC